MKNKKRKVPPRLELGLLDSESNVLTTRPWDLFVFSFHFNFNFYVCFFGSWFFVFCCQG
ncbi:hypothetical protein ACJIZ3_014474 [Penstemon smallii]|uniref:Transmembrane protein n=1 Tax=Penstemon smallii TaxID=265156 RepID=A0ABD3RRA6_9LAMI